MGAFGTSEFENDNALDWVGSVITKPIESVLSSKKPDPDELRAAIGIACILRKAEVYLDKDALKSGLKNLRKLQCNRPWLNMWNDLDKIKTSLRELNANLSVVIGTHPL